MTLYLAYAPEQVECETMERYTAASLRSRKALAAEVERVRAQGWATNIEEWQPGLAVAAAPILSHGRLHGTVALATVVHPFHRHRPHHRPTSRRACGRRHRFTYRGTLAMKVWYRNRIGDARACRISILDHGLLYGDGVFEGIRITNGRVFRLHDHIAHLERSARAIGLELPIRGAPLAEAVLATARANGEAEAYVRQVATGGVGELGVDPASCTEPELFSIVASLRMFPATVRAQGLRLLTSWLRRPAADTLDPDGL